VFRGNVMAGDECSVSLSDATASMEDTIDVSGSVNEDLNEEKC